MSVQGVLFGLASFEHRPFDLEALLAREVLST